MIETLRVDDNLLHGQVAFSWVRNLKIHMIVIADDKVIKDEFAKMTLGLSKPPGVTLKIMSVEDAIVFLHENRESKMNIMAIVNSIANAKRILDNFDGLHSMNIGLLRTAQEVVLKHENTYLNEADLETCRELIQRGIDIEIRLRYDDDKVFLKDLL
ncbi:MAG: PTS system mannose/fructose/N-acetylgalactosamine-transporter subunit IIB [Anaerorhabdus sp.]|uniref:PTS system mannose/fructose/N-acetylgalactosamine-transporter subunit IIB n=1 Tax=Anaerorhabdus sp. TaxID=1872524 RepID=UPI003A89810F